MKEIMIALVDDTPTDWSGKGIQRETVLQWLEKAEKATGLPKKHLIELCLILKYGTKKEIKKWFKK